MKYKNLAIKGHPRGKEVIEILEILGGKNGKLEGDSIESLCGNNPQGIYYIQTCNNLICIRHADSCELNDFIIFTLEEFLEKYPYKVGDKVQDKGSTSWDTIYVIEKMIWEDNQINYIVHNSLNEYPKYTVTAEGLQPYKEEICTYYANDNDSKTDITIDGEKLITPRGYTVKNATKNGNSLNVEYIKNKPQYPKTYNECCNVLIINPKSNDAQGYKADDIICFQELLIARDAYWKIAGDWNPIWNTNIQIKYLITRWNDNIIKETYFTKDCILAFPTEEMRDAFFENFKDLIEKCKEFL